jgi:amino acid permease
VSKLISRKELLEGNLAGRLNKQASTLLALIENHTASLMGESRQAASRHVSLQPYRAGNQAFLTALAQGRDLARPPTIYGLEQYAVQWAALVPENPAVRAAVARLLGRKYRFSRRVTPELSRALGLDTLSVQKAYQDLYRQPLETLFAKRLRIGERVRWSWTRLAGRLENLSPFWTAYALTLTETVGAGILALPITLAWLGPLAGVVVLLVFGLVNTLTLAAITEAITRNGNIRYGRAFFGRLVTDYLGAPGAWLFGVGLLGVNVAALLAYYTGIATTMASVTGVPGEVWSFLLFAITLFVLGRKSLDATVASALLVGLINLTVILILVLLAAPHIQFDHLRHIDLPFVGGRPFDPSILELAFGVVLIAYAGHTSVGNMAKSVLRRDPSGRTFLWGNVAAMLTVTVIYMIWVLAVNGAIPAATLANTTGTALIPLAAVAGRGVDLFGAVFILLGMGMASLHFSLALFNQMRELLPATTPAPGAAKRSFLRHRLVQFWLGVTPVALICLLNVWLLWTGRESFSRPLGLVGALTAPLICGIFPILLLVVSRRKGDSVPGSYWRLLGNPLVVAVIYLLFFASLAVHGLFIWQNPFERIAAGLTCLLVAGVTILIIVRGSLRRRVVVEVRQTHGQGDRALLAVVDNDPRRRTASAGAEGVTVQSVNERTGERVTIDTDEVPHFSSFSHLHLRLPALRARELKIWTHQVLLTGDSVALPAVVTIFKGDRTHTVDLAPSDGQVVLPTGGESCEVEIRLSRLSLPPQ